MFDFSGVTPAALSCDPTDAARPAGGGRADVGGETPPLPGPPADARAARLEKFKREQAIVDYLNRGVSVAEIAAQVGVGEKRMRAIIREILARRMPAPPEEFVAIQVSRLNEALLVAYTAMTDMNLKAVDRVVKIVRELDRYHGFVAAQRRLPETPPQITVRGSEAPAEGTMTFGAALVCSPEFALQGFEKIDSAPGIAMVPVAASAVAATQEQDACANLVLSQSKDAPASANVAARWGMLRDATLRIAPQHEDRGMPSAALAVRDRPGVPRQGSEKIESAPGIEADADNPAGEVATQDPTRASARLKPGEDTPPLDAHPDERPENSPQSFDKIESAPGNGGPGEAAPAPREAWFDTPMVLTPAGWRRPNIRMTLNGVAAS